MTYNEWEYKTDPPPQTESQSVKIACTYCLTNLLTTGIMEMEKIERRIEHLPHSSVPFSRYDEHDYVCTRCGTGVAEDVAKKVLTIYKLTREV